MRRAKSRRKFLGRILVSVIAAAVVGWGLLLYFRPEIDNSTDYERSVADCMRDHTRAVNSPDSQDDAATACVQDSGK
jgi:hypothetical protein